MAKAYLVLCYLSVSNEQALQQYAKLALLRYRALVDGTLRADCP